MKIPKRFPIKGHEWRVEYRWNLREREMKCDGVCDKAARVIFLEHSMPKPDKWVTFLHELMHAVMHELHLGNEGGIDGLVEELVADGVADVLNSLFDLKWKRGVAQ